MCGLPASGKTTTAERWHARLGGVLIRSCDVYQALGILPPYQPTFPRLYARHHASLGIPLPAEAGAGASQRYTGDTSGLGKGELLVWAPR